MKIDVRKPSKKTSKKRHQKVSNMCQKGTPKWSRRRTHEPRFGSLLLVRVALGVQTALTLRPDPTWIPFWLHFWCMFDDFLPMCVSFVRKNLWCRDAIGNSILAFSRGTALRRAAKPNPKIRHGDALYRESEEGSREARGERRHREGTARFQKSW